jgi:MFS family permease
MLAKTLQLYRNAYSGLSSLMWWLAFIMFINRCGTMVIPFLTVYLTDRGFTLAQAGYAMGAFGLGSIAGGYLGGQATDRFGHFPVQVVSLLLNGVLFILLGYMNTLPEFIGLLFVVSTLGEAFRPANAAAVSAFSDDSNRTRCFALNRLAVNLGWAIGPAVGGILATYDYHLLFWADGLTCILASLLLYKLFLPHHQKQVTVQQSLDNTTTSSAWSDRYFLWGMLLLFLVTLCFFQTFSLIAA